MRRPTTAAAVDFSGSAMVALYPRELEARSLALEGEQPADDLHVTLIYLGDARDAIPMLELVQAVAGGCASETEALVGEVGGVATFEDSGEGAPLVLLPDVPGLTEFGTYLRDELARIGVDSASEHGFQPHLTLAYGAPATSAEGRIGQPLHFDAISIVIGKDRFDYPLQSPPQTLLSDANRPRVPLPSGGPMSDYAIQDLAVRALGPEREAELRPADEETVTAAAASQLRWESVLMIEGEPTDDGRMIEEGAIDWRELPLTLMAQFETAEGHQRAVVAGRIDEIWRDGHRIMGRGVFDTGEDGQECARMVGDQMLRGVSVDLAIRKFELRPKDSPEEITDEETLLDLLTGDVEMLYVVTDGSIGAATVCAFPAFADAEIALVASAPELIWRSTCSSEIQVIETLTASGAGLAPVVPPAEWFENPELEEPTPLQVTDDGRIFGHAAVWDTCHIGLENACVMAPRSMSDYAYFLLGEIEVETDETRERIPCGTLTLGTGHANLKLTRERAVEHYDDTGTAVAHLRAGEDEYGIWVAGAMSPDISEERARELRGSKISGDWRRVNGNLELVAMLAVNVPGFPVPRLSATASGEGESLVAAGVADQRMIDAMRDQREIDDLAAEALGLEDPQVEIPEGEPVHGTLVEAALATLAVAHARTAEAVEKITNAGPGDEERGKRELALAQKSLEIIDRFASRGHAPVPDVHVDVSVPDRTVTVEAPTVTVNVPEQPAPVVELKNEVHVPEQAAPQVVVAAAPAPEVRIEPAPPRSVRVTEDPETGERIYVQE